MIVPATDETVCAVCHERMPASAPLCLSCGAPLGAVAQVEIRPDFARKLLVLLCKRLREAENRGSQPG